MLTAPRRASKLSTTSNRVQGLRVFGGNVGGDGRVWLLRPRNHLGGGAGAPKGDGAASPPGDSERKAAPRAV
jgi:hypothetical protein